MSSKIIKFFGCAIIAGSIVSVNADEVIMKVGFDEGTTEAFNSEFPGASLTISEDEYSVGSGSLKCTADTIVDVEKYIKYSDKDTKIGFHYYADGMRIIRVLAQSVADKENLYFNMNDVRQKQWCWAVVSIKDLKNVIPRHGSPNDPFGKVTGKNKSFRNIVFHLMGVDKKTDNPVIYLDNIVLYNSPDSTPPGVCTGLSIESEEDGTTFLTWNDAKDNVGVAYYRIYKGEIATFKANKKSFLMTTVIPEIKIKNTKMYYKIIAVDYDGNRSRPSIAVQKK